MSEERLVALFFIVFVVQLGELIIIHQMRKHIFELMEYIISIMELLNMDCGDENK